MKKLIYTLTILLIFSACQDLDELNENPNAAETVPSGYIMTYVISGTARAYKSLGNYNSDISGAMQYIQQGTNEKADEINYYNWTPESWSTYYDLLRNVKIIHENSLADGNKMFEAISLTLKAFLFGTITDLYGDIPYEESLQASEGVYFPAYEEQKFVYQGVLEDLKQASMILADPSIQEYTIDPNADIIYQGDVEMWRKFTNALRLRYSMRLFNKQSEMAELGVNIINEFNDAAAFTFQSVDESAVVEYLGTTPANSFPGGNLNSSNPPFLTKMSKTMVDKLQALADPRLQRWVRPVKRKWDFNISNSEDVEVTNRFGESYTVTYMPTTNMNLDTALFVGLPVGIPSGDAIVYNSNNETIETPEQSPYISFLHSRFFENNGDLISMELMTYSEVEFLMAEAALKGGFSISGSPEDHYKNGIMASMHRWDIEDGMNQFDFETYYNSPEVNLGSATNPLERIMEQKWISQWLTPEAWFDWRRTGFPALEAGPVNAYGAALPIRYMYPVPNQDESYMVNYAEAVQRLEVTNYVPSGQSRDHSYSKMWLLQGTSKPW